MIRIFFILTQTTCLDSHLLSRGKKENELCTCIQPTGSKSLFEIKLIMKNDTFPFLKIRMIYKCIANYNYECYL